MIHFAAYTSAKTPDAFQWARQPQKLLVLMGDQTTPKIARSHGDQTTPKIARSHGDLDPI